MAQREDSPVSCGKLCVFVWFCWAPAPSLVAPLLFFEAKRKSGWRMCGSSGVLVFVVFLVVCCFFATYLDSYSRTSGESNHHRQSVSDTRVPRYQLSHEDDLTVQLEPLRFNRLALIRFYLLISITGTSLRASSAKSGKKREISSARCLWKYKLPLVR